MPPAATNDQEGSVSTPRRSRRVSLSLASQSSAKKSTAAPPLAKRSKKRSRLSSSRARSDSLDDDEDGVSQRKPAAKRRKAPVLGLNPLPTLFPSLVEPFTFDIPSIPAPSEAARCVFVFGNGDSGQNGLGPEVTAEIKKPRLQKWFEERISAGGAWDGGVAEMTSGGMFTLAIDGEGRVWSWGVNDAAALGRVTAHDSDNLEYEPMLIESLKAEDFSAVRVAAGDSFGVATSDLGELRAWGSFRNVEGVPAFDTAPGAPQFQFTPMAFPALSSHSIVQIATGNDHFIALTTTGYVFACGRGEQNQLGRKIIARHTTHGLTPERLGLKKIVTIGSGSYHSFAVSEEGKVYAWGLNSFRQLGVSPEDGGEEETLATPTIIDSLLPEKHGGAKVVQIVGGEHHTAFLLSNGEVYVCGRSDGYESGLPDEHEELVAMALRKSTALAKRKERQDKLVAELTAAGELSEMEIGLEAARLAANQVPLPNDFIPLPTLLPFPDASVGGMIDISAATHNTFAVSSNGQLFAWGLGLSSQLGLGDAEEAEQPTRVVSVALEGFRVLKVAAGGQHSSLLAIRGEGAKPSVFQKAVKANGVIVEEDEEEKKEELVVVEEDEEKPEAQDEDAEMTEA